MDTVHRPVIGVSVPLPSADSFVSDIKAAYWNEQLAWFGAVAAVLGAILVIRAFSQ